MKIALFNGNENADDREFETRLSALTDLLTAKGHEVDLIHLRELDLRRCIGCFGCWVKTPGRCLIRDESELLCRAMVNSDVVFHVSPLVMGFVSPLIRMASERMIPVIMPYMELKEGEVRHSLRYEHYARLGLLYAEEEDTDEEDLDITRSIYEQITSEFHQDLFMFGSLRSPVEEIDLH